MVATIDLFQLIFEQILKIDPTVISKYATVQDQLLYLILIPHVIIFLFLFSFGIWIIKEHRGLRYLLVIVSYLYIVWGGWYSWIAEWLVGFFWWKLILGSAFLFFLISRIIPPARAMGLHKLAGEAGASIHEMTMGKSKKRKALEDEIEKLLAERRAYESRLLRPYVVNRPRAQEAIQLEIADIDRKIARLRAEESKL